MRTLKYVLTGLFISSVIFVFMLGAIIFLAPESLPADVPLPEFLIRSTPAPGPSFTAVNETPVSTATDAASPAPSSTLDALIGESGNLATATVIHPTSIPFTPTLALGPLMIQSGALVISGPRTPDEQVRLYENSLQFLASSFKEAKAIGEQINGPGYGSPTLICGPLSIAILRAAGLISPSVVPHDFWILNPDDATGRQKLRDTFPRALYTDMRIRTRIDRFDWRSQPLQPGDFIYLYAGTNGTFEHMLVVNRVDNAGRAYSVTNLNTPTGFVIQEVLLYDPTDSNAGVFHQWTDHLWIDLGLTGYGGFELWRLIPVEPTPRP